MLSSSVQCPAEIAKSIFTSLSQAKLYIVCELKVQFRFLEARGQVPEECAAIPYRVLISLDATAKKMIRTDLVLHIAGPSRDLRMNELRDVELTSSSPQSFRFLRLFGQKA